MAPAASFSERDRAPVDVVPGHRLELPGPVREAVFLEDILRSVQGARQIGPGQVLQVKFGGQRCQGQQGG